ncbi:hypothetical protein GGS20DRAFT_327682 [Poronia punctata]|nr:hypothetical protein GGS20DRAFT_327682 [Poronia punctata]
MMEDDTTRSTSQKKPPLSCTSCRTRKLKCDKKDPCHNCLRTGSECIFPARKRIQRPRKNKNTELLRRLNRLESIVGKVGLADLEKVVDAGGESAELSGAKQETAQILPRQPTPSNDDDDDDDDDGFCGMKDVAVPASRDTTASRYLSGEFWSSLCDEVGGLRQALEQSTDSDDDIADGDDVSPESTGGVVTSVSTSSPGMLLGSWQTNTLQTITHPSPEQIRYLALAYFRNVDMHLKILHRPTILHALYNLADNAEEASASDLSPEREALFFAIYYAAITSISPAECTRNLHRPRADISRIYQAAFERALVRADYLNNTSLETLQALTLYTCCLRSHDGSRASWALLGLPIRLAQALNMHQDGDGDGTHSRFSPYEAEMRRRLWWQLIVLDIRAAEDRGTNTIIARGSYDTRLPHNIDDTEFGPDTTAPLRDRDGPSDATFSLCAAQSSGLFLYFEHAQGAGPVQSEEDTVRRAQHLESLFVKGADPGHVGSYLASVTVRLIILKMWLVMRYPLHPRGGARRKKPGPDSVTTTTTTTTKDDDNFLLNPGLSSWSSSLLKSSSSSQKINTTTSPPTSSSLSAARAAGNGGGVTNESTLRTAISIIELHEFMQTGPYSDRFRWWTDTYVQWHPLSVALAELCTQTRGETVERAWQIIDNVFPRWSATIADAKRGNLWRPLRKLYKRAKTARAAVATTTSSSSSSLGDHYQQQREQTQTQISWGPNNAFEPTSTPTSLNDTPHPRFISDMIIPESSAPHALPPPPPPPNTESVFAPKGDVAIENNFNFDAVTPSWFPWPDLSFDMGAIGPDITQSDPLAMADTGTGLDPTLLDSNTMDWTTWDEFVLDTYADSTPKSNSGASEGS